MEDQGPISSTLNVRFFCTKIRFGSFLNVHVTRKSCQNVTFVQKMRVKNVDEIEPRLLSFLKLCFMFIKNNTEVSIRELYFIDVRNGFCFPHNFQRKDRKKLN